MFWSTETMGTASLACWCSGAVTVVVGQGLSKVLPWPVAVLVGGATAGFVHRTLITASDSVADSLSFILSSFSLASGVVPWRDTAAAVRWRDAAAAVHSPTSTSSPATPTPAETPPKPPPVKEGPQPNDGLLVPMRHRLGMAAVDTWTDVECARETTMFLDREPDAIITPIDVGRDFDPKDYYGPERLPHVLADASHASQVLQAILIPPDAVLRDQHAST